MKRKILFRKNQKLGKGVVAHSETAITKRGRISDSYKVTERDANGDLHIFTEQFITKTKKSPKPKTAKKESKKNSTKKSTSTKKKTTTKSPSKRK